ncbi:enolase-phosphatase E1-like [Argopecten irradians]|uniref:enolase-phosphatase E1-like n=1 Tax=Argopecten irradians TaxID=31199 RepID=UPI0037167452
MDKCSSRQFLFLFFNFLFLCLGIALVGFVSWTLATIPNANEFISGTHVVTLTSFCLGFVILIIGGIGCAAGFCRGLCVLKTYVGFMLTLIFLELGLVFFIYAEKSQLPSVIVSSWDGLNTDTQYKIQTELECCGIENYTEYGTEVEFYPSSCFVVYDVTGIIEKTIDNLFTADCLTQMQNWLNDNIPIWVSVLIVIAVIEFLSGLTSCIFLQKVQKRLKVVPYDNEENKNSNTEMVAMAKRSSNNRHSNGVENHDDRAYTPGLIRVTPAREEDIRDNTTIDYLSENNIDAISTKSSIGFTQEKSDINGPALIVVASAPSEVATARKSKDSVTNKEVHAIVHTQKGADEGTNDTMEEENNAIVLNEDITNAPCLIVVSEARGETRAVKKSADSSSKMKKSKENGSSEDLNDYKNQMDDISQTRLADQPSIMIVPESNMESTIGKEVEHFENNNAAKSSSKEQNDYANKDKNDNSNQCAMEQTLVNGASLSVATESGRSDGHKDETASTYSLHDPTVLLVASVAKSEHSVTETTTDVPVIETETVALTQTGKDDATSEDINEIRVEDTKDINTVNISPISSQETEDTLRERGTIKSASFEHGDIVNTCEGDNTKIDELYEKSDISDAAYLLSNQEAVNIKNEGEIELPHTDVTGTSEIDQTNVRKEREESPTEVETAKSNDDESENDDMHDDTKIDNTDKNDSTETTDTSNGSLDKEETDAKYSVEASMANIPSVGVGVVATSAELLSNKEEADIKVEGEIEMPHTEVTGTLEIENQNEQEIVETVSGQEQEESKNVATSDEATDIETTNDSKEDNTESDDTKKTDSIETTDISHAPEDMEETNSKFSIDANVEMTTTLEDGVAAYAAESQSNEVSVDIKVDGEIDIPQTEVSANLEIENQNKQDICVETLSGQHQQDSINVATSDEATDIETTNDSKEDNTESDDTNKKDSIEITYINAVPEDKEEKDAKSSLNGNVEITSTLEDDVAASSTESQSSEESVNIKVDGEIDLPQSEVTGSLEIEIDVCKEREKSSTEVETVKSTDGQSDKDDIDDNAESDKTDRNDSSVEASMETIPSLGVDVPASSAELLSNQEAVDIKVEGEVELPHTNVTGTLEIETDDSKERKNPKQRSKYGKYTVLGVGVAATSAELLSNQEEVDIKVEGEIELPHTEVTGTLEIENQNEQEIVVETVLGQEQEESKDVATSNEATDIETTNDSKEDNTESDDIKKTDSIETTDISHAPEDMEETNSKFSIDANVEMTTTLEDGVAASAAESQSNEVSVDMKVDGEIDMPQTEVSANLEIANQNEQEIVVETVSGQEQEESKNVATSDEATDIETTNDSNERITPRAMIQRRQTQLKQQILATQQKIRRRQIKILLKWKCRNHFRLGR